MGPARTSQEAVAFQAPKNRELTIGIYGGDDHGEDWVGFPGKFDKKAFLTLSLLLNMF